MRGVYKSIWIPLRLVAFMVAVFWVTNYMGWDVRQFANLPRTLEGLLGILFAPLIHVNSFHLMANAFPILCLGTVIYWFYPRVAFPVLIRSYFGEKMKKYSCESDCKERSHGLSNF